VKKMSDTSVEMPDNMTNRPLVTFALFAYNQEKYIRQAVEGALSQTYEPMEIILSDDCSSDRTYTIMKEMVETYSGRHSIVLRRNKRNIGLAAHFNEVIKHSMGEIIIIAAGDDISFSSRTDDSVRIFSKHPDVTAVLLSADVINQNGEVVGFENISRDEYGERTQTLQDLTSWQHATFGATRAIRKEVVVKFGPLQDECPTEDTPLLLRSLICGRNVLSPLKGIQYRKHDNNLSSAASLARMNTDEIYAQYRRDISMAKTIGLIGTDEVKQLLDWVVRDQKVRFFRQKINSGEELGIAEVHFVVCHPAFGGRAKLKTVMQKIKSFSETVVRRWRGQ